MVREGLDIVFLVKWVRELIFNEEVILLIVFVYVMEEIGGLVEIMYISFIVLFKFILYEFCVIWILGVVVWK